MNEIELRKEIMRQWLDTGWPRNDPRTQLVDQLVRMSAIAWQALAEPPRGEALDYVRQTAGALRCRSENPKTVLRKLIEYAEVKHGWTATPSVLRAAGRQVKA